MERLIREKGVDFLFLGVFVGIIAWIIQSPVLMILFHFNGDRSSFYANLLIAILIGMFFSFYLFNLSNIYKKIFLFLLLTSVAFSSIYYGGLTESIKVIFDKISFIEKPSNNHFFLSYMIAYGFLLFIFRSIFIAVENVFLEKKNGSKILYEIESKLSEQIESLKLKDDKSIEKLVLKQIKEGKFNRLSK